MKEWLNGFDLSAYYSNFKLHHAVECMLDLTDEETFSDDTLRQEIGMTEEDIKKFHILRSTWKRDPYYYFTAVVTMHTFPSSFVMYLT